MSEVNWTDTDNILTLLLASGFLSEQRELVGARFGAHLENIDRLIERDKHCSIPVITNSPIHYESLKGSI